jgi:membrane protein implicated in regulation of membrane protease activity
MSSHPIDVLSLGTGVMFTVFALAYLIIPGSMSLALSIPLMLVGLGVFGLVAAIVTQRRRQAQQPQN